MAKGTRDRITASDLEDLAVAVEQLTEETRVLRQAIDELRDDVVWAARQVLSAGDMVAPNQGFCRPRDPLAPDADLRSCAQLSIDSHDGIEYCCVAPRLAWSGDPDSPGVECQNCGYVVAESGQVVYQPNVLDEDTDKVARQFEMPVAPQARQGSLFLDDSDQ